MDLDGNVLIDRDWFLMNTHALARFVNGCMLE